MNILAEIETFWQKSDIERLIHYKMADTQSIRNAESVPNARILFARLNKGSTFLLIYTFYIKPHTTKLY